MGNLARHVDDLSTAKTQLEEARDIFVQIGHRLGQANTLHAMGRLALESCDLNSAQTHLEAARGIYLQNCPLLSQANALLSLGTLALLRDHFDHAKAHLEAARNLYLQIGHKRGQANALQFLSDLMLRGNDLNSAKVYAEAARNIYADIGDKLGESNAHYSLARVEMKSDLIKSEKVFNQALQSYDAISDKWGIAHSALCLAQIAALQGDPSRLPNAVDKILRYEASHPTKLAAPGWRAFCASLLEHDEAKRAAFCDQARRLWTEIGALGLIKDYVDFEISVAVADHTDAED